MAEYTKQVFKVGQSEKANASGQHWMVVTTEGKEAGKTKQENIFDEKIRAKFSDGPGVYKLTYQKKGTFWNITDAQRIGNIPGSNGHATNGATAPAVAVGNLKMQIATVAISVAGALGLKSTEPIDETVRAFRVLSKELSSFIEEEKKEEPKPEPVEEETPF